MNQIIIKKLASDCFYLSFFMVKICQTAVPKNCDNLVNNFMILCKNTVMMGDGDCLSGVHTLFYKK
jgi:hypothetical protein